MIRISDKISDDSIQKGKIKVQYKKRCCKDKKKTQRKEGHDNSWYNHTKAMHYECIMEKHEACNGK